MKLVIDFGAIAHAIRRWLWRKFGGKPSFMQCSGCGKELTQDEATYYVCHCERCEGIAMQEMEDAA